VTARPRRALLAAVGCACAAVLAGCAATQPPNSAGPAISPSRAAAPHPGSGAVRSSAAATTPAGAQAPSPAPAAPGRGGLSPGPAPVVAAGPAAFCAAAPLGRLTRALASAVPGSAATALVPLGAAPDGRTAYVAAWTHGFAGVAALNLATGRLHAISPFPDPAADQADGAAAGRWLVWTQTSSVTDLDSFTVDAWDAGSGRLRVLGRSLPGPDGTPWPSPWHAPAVSGHYAAWAQGYGPGGLVEIELADLDTGVVVTVRRGHVQAPFFDGRLLVWPESDRPGSETSLRAYSLATGAPAALPAVLQPVRGTDFVVTDGHRTAYLSPDFSRLLYSPAQDQPARPVLALPAGNDFTDLAIAPGVLAWSSTTATFLASTSTGAYAQVTPKYGYPTGSGSVMLISDAPTQQAAHPPLPTHVVHPAALAWPACPPVPQTPVPQTPVPQTPVPQTPVP
jgi:hypothetical protein